VEGTLCYMILMVRLVKGMFRKYAAYMVLVGWWMVSIPACSTVSSSLPYQEGQIIASPQNTVVSFQDLRSALLEAEVVYIGETHYTPSHIEAALHVLRTLIEAGRTPILGMEMFGWDGQAGLNRYIKGEITSVDAFLAESQWKNNWGGHYQDYSPLVDFAKHHNIKLLGLNPPRSMVRNVAQKGLAVIKENPDVQVWNMPDPFPEDDPEYRRVIYEQIESCHGGMSQEVYQKIYEASVFRDEGMASVITTTLKSQASGQATVVSYTGAGHIQYGLPIPKRVQRQMEEPIQQVTVYLHALDPEHPEDVDHLLKEQIADFIWLTELGPHGRQPRCGE